MFLDQEVNGQWVLTNTEPSQRKTLGNGAFELHKQGQYAIFDCVCNDSQTRVAPTTIYQGRRCVREVIILDPLEEGTPSSSCSLRGLSDHLRFVA